MIWLRLLPYGIASAVTLALSIMAHNWRVDNLEAAWQKKREVAVAEAIATEMKTCADNQAITRESEHALQEKFDDISDLLTATNRQLRAAGAAKTCLPVTDSARGGHEVSGGNVFSVPSEELARTAGTCDQQTAQLIACQRFIADTWARHDRKPE